MYPGSIEQLRLGAQAVTRTAIRTIPKKLPHASIYLDDLFEIEEILSCEYAKLPESPKISFEYEIDNKITVTTHEELIEHEGHSKRFALNVVSDESYLSDKRVLSMYYLIEPTFEAPYVFGDMRWAIFGKVDEIFKARSDRLKNFAELFSFKIILLILAPGVLYNILSVGHIGFSYSAPVALLIQGLPGAIIIIVSFGGLKSNRIYFRYIRQDEMAKTSSRKEQIGKLIWLLAGAVVGTIATLIADPLKH
jgi:hypothetical protein